MHVTLSLTLETGAVAWWIIGISALVSLILIAVGVFRALGAVRGLKAKTDAFKEMPILAQVAATQTRFERLEARRAEAERLVPRLKAALESIPRSQRQLTAALRAAFEPFRAAGRDLVAILAGLRG